MSPGKVPFATRGLVIAAAFALAQPAHQAVAQGDRPVAPPAPGHGPVSADQLRPETQERFRRLIRPADDEYVWRKIRWHTDFWVARQQAAAQDKPILVFWLDGAGYHDPLGLC